MASVHHLMGAVAILSLVSLFTLKVLSRSQSDLPLEKFDLGQLLRIIFTRLSILLEKLLKHSVYQIMFVFIFFF